MKHNIVVSFFYFRKLPAQVSHPGPSWHPWNPDFLLQAIHFITISMEFHLFILLFHTCSMESVLLLHFFVGFTFIFQTSCLFFPNRHQFGELARNKNMFFLLAPQAQTHGAHSTPNGSARRVGSKLTEWARNCSQNLTGHAEWARSTSRMSSIHRRMGWKPPEWARIVFF